MESKAGLSGDVRHQQLVTGELGNRFVITSKSEEAGPFPIEDRNLKLMSWFSKRNLLFQGFVSFLGEAC